MSLSLSHRASIAIAGAIALTLTAAGSASAHHCVNASKNQAAGVQIVFDVETFEPVWISAGLQKRIDAGLVNMETGEGFHGLYGIDFDGDGVADVSTWQIGTGGSLPQKAIENGAECAGIVDIEDFFACVG